MKTKRKPQWRSERIASMRRAAMKPRLYLVLPSKKFSTRMKVAAAFRNETMSEMACV